MDPALIGGEIRLCVDPQLFWFRRLGAETRLKIQMLGFSVTRNVSILSIRSFGLRVDKAIPSATSATLEFPSSFPYYP